MKQRVFKKALLILSLALLATPLLIVHSAGGRIEGKVTDPKGAVIVGATVIVTDPITKQTFTAVTDQQGHYKVAALPAGSYSLTVSARGFSDARRDDVRVQDGALATVDLKLEIAPIEAAVTVASPKATGDPVYQQLRLHAKGAGDFAGPFATVNNLVLKRDAATFTLRSGEIYFAPAVNDRMVGAVFLGEGELTLTPPTETEKHSLKLFTDEPTITESFGQLILRITE